MTNEQSFTEEQLKQIEIMKSDERYPNILKEYGHLNDYDLLALWTMGEALFDLNELSKKVENSAIKKYVDRIEEEKSTGQSGI